MASDLIDREQIMRDLMHMDGYEKSFAGLVALEKIASAPAVDAVEVVRCKECKYCAVDKYVKRPFCILNGEVRPNGHIWFGVGVSEDHYCSHGVRKEKKDAVD